eukprot:jgi/Ulvmu1/2579/UM014_0030.1
MHGASLAGDHKSESMLKLNPRGQLPVLIDGDAIVNDSMAIMHYLEAMYPSAPLLPSGKAKLALACQRLHESSAMYHAVQPALFAKIAGKVNSDEEKDQFQQHIDATHKEMDFFEGYLSDGRKFFIGEMFTLADICVAVFLFTCMQYGATLDKHPQLKAFAKRLKERSCFKETWPSAWDEHKNLDWLVEL